MATTTITEADVLAAAMELMRGGGVAALSMRRLAEELGVSYQVVYSRIGGKGEVVRALHDQGFARWMDADDTFTTPLGSPERIHEVAHDYLDAALDDPLQFDLMFAAPVPEFRRDAAALEVEWDAFGTCWLAPTGAFLDATVGERPDGTTRRLAWRLWSTVHGITTVHVSGHDSPTGDPHDEVAAMVRLLLADPLASAAP